MLIPVLVALVLAVCGALVVLKVAHVAARRLGLDPHEVMVWFGLAEAPIDELEARRRAQPSARVRSKYA